MADAPTPGCTRRQFLVGGAAGAASVWVNPKLGWLSRADALAADGSGFAGAALTIAPLPFSDSFDQEFPAPGALLTNWSVTRPVTLAGTTQFGVACPANKGLDTTGFLAGHGIVVAMDGPFGSSTGPGRIETVQAFPFRVGLYTLSFQVAGSHHGADAFPATLTASVPGCGAAMTVSRAASDGFLRYSLRFVVRHATLSTIVFESGDAPGQAGLLLDDVSLVAGVTSRASEPAGAF